MIDTVTIQIHRHTKRNQRIYDQFLRKLRGRVDGFIPMNSKGVLEATDLVTSSYTHYHVNDKVTLNLNGKIYIPSWNYHIYFTIKEDYVSIEFSLPKLIYGTNVIQLLPHRGTSNKTAYDMFIRGIKFFFDSKFQGYPVDYGAITVNRWDFCFNQVFNSKSHAQAALRIFKKRSKKSHGKLDYENGVVELTKSSYFKIYHKGAEFEAHDRRKIMKLRTISERDRRLYSMLDPLQRMADCILRFERKYLPSSIAREFNLRVTFNGDKEIRKEYNTIKKKDKLSKAEKYLINAVQAAPIITIGEPLIEDAHKLPDWFFDWTYSKFRDELRNKWTINRKNPLTLDDLAEKQDAKNRRMMKNIHLLVERYGSIKLAYEDDAISKSAYYKYKKFLEEHDINTEIKRFVIEQDFTNKKYYRAIRNYRINSFLLSNSSDF